MKKGAKLGGYELIEPLGSGGAGTVFMARSPRGDLVALKVLHRHDEAGLARFDRERRLLAEFGEAEGFVPLLDAGTTPHGPFLVMPFLGGGTLRDRLEKGPLPVDEALALATRLARALGRAHEKGIVHRDVKPENILFRDPRTPLVADLGLAKHYSTGGESPSMSLSKTGVFKGTAGYMPPEQMRDAKLVGPPADVFALGAVLYECLAGEPPFRGETGLELMAAVELAHVPPLASVRKDVPAWLSRVVNRALARAVPARFQDGHRLADALEARETARSGSKRPVVAALLLVAGVTVVAAFGVRQRRDRTAPDVAPSTSSVAHEEVDLCAGFRAGKGFKLESVFGRHDWKHTRDVYGATLSPDGTRAVTCGRERNVHAWDTATGRELWSVVTESEFSGAVAFSPSGDRVALGGDWPGVKILDAGTGRLLVKIEGHGGGTGAVRWLPDGRHLLSAGGPYDKDADKVTIKEWDAASGALVRTIPGPTGIASKLAITPDGKRVFSAGNGGELIEWDLERGERVKTFGGNERLTGVAVTPDRRWAFTSDNDLSVVRQWDLETGGHRDLEPFKANVFGVALSADGRRLAAVAWEGIRVWELPGPKLVWDHPEVHGRAIAMTPDGRRLLTGHQDGVVRFWDLDEKKELGARAGFDGPVVALAATKSRLVGASASERHFEVRELRQGVLVTRKEVGATVVSCLLSPDGTKAAVLRAHHPNEQAEHERTIYDTTNGAVLFTAQDIQADYPPSVAAFSPNSHRVLVGDRRGLVSSFETDADYRNLGRFVPGGLGTPVNALAFLDDDVHWMSGDDRGAVTFAETKGSPEDPTFAAGSHRTAVTAVAVRRHHAVSGDREGALKMWDPGAHRFLKDLLPSHERTVLAAAVSEDGRRAATASEDGTIAIWDLDKAQRVATIDLATSSDSGRALLFDGERLYVGTARGVVLTFELVR
ncbi:MAG TPA: protein kinase [Planctomycetota bacterium]|nr:protein kinase [Planctomycetota bacterium]